ncbi:MAG: helix-turn-helix domain-containing protein, partial [Myxococcales bacterium]|nr:helix-turn-helix domain-containing protein [Myxococcales bacterium]
APIPPPARPSPSEPVELPIPGLRLLHLRRDELRRRGTRLLSGRRLLERLRALDAHFVVVDLGAGTTGPILDTFLGADISLFVTLPEPTAIENTYRFARAAFMRQLRTRLPEPGDRQRVEQALASAGGSLPPIDLVRQLEGRPSMPPPPPGSTALPAPSVGGVVRELLGEFRFRLVVNQARIRADLEIGDSLRSVARRRLGLCFDYLGYVDFDDTVWTCVRSRRPVLVESPGTKASRSMEKIARRVLAIASGKAAPPTFRNVPPESLHDLLEVDRGATDEEVRRAYKRAREIYAPDSLAVYGLFDAAGLETLQARLAEAYDVLLDPSRRRPYELSVFPIEPDADEGDAQEEERSEPLPAPPPITPETDFTGPLLRAVRESQGIDLRAVSERTKIGSAYLEALESDDFKSLPALVYVRGFVTEVAKFLRLDSEQVSRTYVRRYSRYLEERSR